MPSHFARTRSGENAETLGAVPGSLGAVGGEFEPSTPQVVTDTCPTPDQLATWVGGSELAVQVSKPTASTAYGVGLDIYYVSPGSTATHTTPFGIAL